MKTYTRKRPEYQIIEGARDLCRLCLEKAEESIPIFTGDSGNMCEAKVALRIMICVGLEMTKDDCLPNQVCLECHNELERYYTFRKKCEISYLKLKSHLLAFRIKEVGKNIEKDTVFLFENDNRRETQSEVSNNITFKVNYDGSIMVCDEKQSHSNLKTLVTLARIDEKKPTKLLQSSNTIIQNNIPGSTLQSNNTISQSNNILGSTLQSNNTISQSNNILGSTLPSNNTISQSNNILGSTLQSNNTISQSNDIPGCTLQSNNTISQSSTTSTMTVSEKNIIISDNNEGFKSEQQSCLDVKCNETVQSVGVEVQNEVSHADLSTFLSGLLIELGVLTQQGDDLVIVDQEMTTIELETEDGRQVVWELSEEDVESVQENVEDSKLLVPLSENQMNLPLSVTVSSHEGNKNIVVQYVSDLDKNNPEKQLQTISVDNKHAVAGTCCHLCGRTFASRSVCARHVRCVHSRTRPHVCTVCGHSFAQKEVLTRHELVHKDVRPHQCSQCPKSFTQRGALRAHERSHTPPQARPLALYSCAICPKVFLYASGLTRHVLSHTGRRYQCDGCKHQFKDKSSLNRHLKNTNHAACTKHYQSTQQPAS